MIQKPENDARGPRVSKSGKTMLTASEVAESFSRDGEGFAAICRAITDHISVIDRDHRIIWVNDIAKHHFGPDLVGKKCYAAYHGADRPCSSCIVGRVFSDGGIHAHETVVTDRNGAELNFWCTASPVMPHEEGRPMAVIEISRDITGLRITEEALQRSKEQLRNLSDYIQTARERERSRIAREIHDDLGQVLTAIKLDIAWIKKRLGPDAAVDKKTIQVMELVDHAIHSVQRITSELRPPLLNDIGLTAALEWQVKEFSQRMGIRADFTDNCGEIGLDEKKAVTLYRICQESLTNIARHSRASRAWVRLSRQKGDIKLAIRDNGIGMSEETMTKDDAFGLMGIRERALTAGGTAEIKSAPGKGTLIKITIS